MRIAVLDLGTNTFNLLIAEIAADNSFQKLVSERIPVKLGESTINHGVISDAAYKRGIEALYNYRKIIDEFNIDLIKAFATSAIRTASNGQAFAQEAFEKFNMNIEIIEGEREAELIYKGVRLAVNMDDSKSLVMDIGGGSTEFIICNKNEIFWKKSFLLGAARLLDKFKPENPIKNETIQAINNYFKQELDELANAIKIHQPKRLIGSSGAFDSFVDMMADGDPTKGLKENMYEYNITIPAYKVVAEKTIHSTHEERIKMQGLIPMRIDMIVISYLFSEYILNTFNFNTFIASTFSLKEGVMAEAMEELYNA